MLQNDWYMVHLRMPIFIKQQKIYILAYITVMGNILKLEPPKPIYSRSWRSSDY